ncbi:DUF1702 family protein [Lentzea cavernae]|uniref:Enediyne biosynthesis protein n=1 Tax=Lentzea cavernae TaxID=2020703 RepID=A0ABQ3MJA5_9PSEU|nr:DUF1702 family protein [Lentzea cavernae]GHH39593.1 hypothetical protein GCM10017774_31480 [Lentzea cavernae]
MSSVLGSIRRLVFAPALADVTFASRGFTVVESETTRALEQIPQTVIAGFEWGIDCRSSWELERRLSLVAPELRGFAYEGATMACTVLDAMDGRKRTRDLLRGHGLPHLFLAYIGIGFAMARLPRPLWRKVVPDLEGVRYHPAITWLAVDGYGFDRAYFHPKRWVAGQEPPKPYPWQGTPSYFSRAFDQGLGRALWFIHGADVKAVAGAVRAFTGHRRPDLWSGVGLAATFAGGATPEDLAWLRAEAGEQGPQLALGAALAVMAKAAAGHVDDHAEDAVLALGDLSATDAVTLVETASVPTGESGPEPEYERWRGRIRAHFTT